MLAKFGTMAGVIAVSACTVSAQLDVVVPNSVTNVNGNSNNGYPFAWPSWASQRYQQVYASSEFAAFGGPQTITEIRFRPDADWHSGPWSNTMMLDLRFSITQVVPDQMSLTFADNVGINETVVYSGNITLETPQPEPGPTQTVMDFDLIIPFQTPFEYDPSLGNLLMEVRRDGSSLTSSRPMDAVNIAGDSVSRVSTTSTGNSSSPTGAHRNSIGLVTLFVVDAPPFCYANCDNSTVEPVLNVDDFTCFINEFAAAQSLPHEQQVAHYANCDGSTVAPVLNVDDFTCFINEFAAGCP